MLGKDVFQVKPVIDLSSVRYFGNLFAGKRLAKVACEVLCARLGIDFNRAGTTELFVDENCFTWNITPNTTTEWEINYHG